ncbi:hypothetical protein BJX63DRAFT_432303 [Aspergillus granulosus]|uniref:Uncharacterized protein n=1 Tax=Aspergillus granulosus TaxID=176169 RepID=A0ABR4HCJ6_9EURO
MPEMKTVAVIGLGASGLVTMKNLTEEGFDVSGFERSSSIGGVWSYEDTLTKTTALKSTCANGSKYKFCFTDFPYSSGSTTPPILQLQNQLHTVQTEWNFNDNLPPFTQRLPLMNDNIVAAMHEGRIIPVSNLTQVLDAQTVLLSDGTTISDLDAIICCTGYKPDFSILGNYEAQFSRIYHCLLKDHSEGDSSAPSSARFLPRLYQNIFSLDYPDSLAYICGVGFQMPMFHVYDLASMALAQVWKGAVPLPPLETMRAQVEQHYQWIVSRARQGSIHPDLVQASEWYLRANETAGTGVYQKLGYGVERWKFWWRDRVFCNTLMYEMFSPHTYRLFDGSRRRKWDGARAEILRVIKEINEMGSDVGREKEP